MRLDKRTLPVESGYQLMPPLAGDDYEALKASIAAVGVLQPVVVTEDGTILDGHHRAQVCDELGLDYPTTTVAGLSEEERVAQVLALNVARRHLTREQKRELVAGLSGRGMSVRQIAAATGIPRSTVQNYLKPPAVPNGTPEQRPRLDGGQLVQAAIMQEIATLEREAGVKFHPMGLEFPDEMEWDDYQRVARFLETLSALGAGRESAEDRPRHKTPPMTRPAPLKPMAREAIREAYQEATTRIAAYLEEHPDEPREQLCREIDPDNWQALAERVEQEMEISTVTGDKTV